jgi:hypothetical protein
MICKAPEKQDELLPHCSLGVHMFVKNFVSHGNGAVKTHSTLHGSLHSAAVLYRGHRAAELRTTLHGMYQKDQPKHMCRGRRREQMEHMDHMTARYSD